MNTKKTWAILLVVILFGLLFGNPAIAARCRNMVGEWELKGNKVCNNGDYQAVKETLTIEGQKGCLFYGSAGTDSITGVLVQKGVTMTIGDVTYLGKLRGINKMSLTFSDIESNSDLDQCAGSGTATRKKKKK